MSQGLSAKQQEEGMALLTESIERLTNAITMTDSLGLLDLSEKLVGIKYKIGRAKSLISDDSTKLEK